eukprot:CAMPEP_0169140470 /NCGR_PEP_ID=MMETSP1015-20121227/43624_1 /TAXON_ID=342587 /ORGANISM="Karlodinium micrum, Strain CCMP2283" /LENGTH=37 /DNA_ID= /DNA_START= /DNA_END= /DNA_ORIENTATION=
MPFDFSGIATTSVGTIGSVSPGAKTTVKGGEAPQKPV